ncbi:apolipoprotein N-acyltransferase [Synechococcus sp. ATX 2A4]|uniref:apolipoprotein N-acyltransferase n=1 Tax=Synechococcus sp. ATX 2A4 TaxID=2823727 RepID=UPI0020CF6775|nr:apolipoprotein N-acyltransferase [Synechococcus sp. ATX 2A4]MCP9884268.1 apolipoprotein N-acyltransferase [Synechococcus sp. ATX 2A4]
MGNDRPLPWDSRPLTAPVTALLAGALAGLTFAPWGFPPLLWLALVPLWGQTTPAGAALWGGAAVLVSHRWLLWLHPLDWVGVPLPLSLPLCVALWGALALLGAALVALWSLLVRRLDPRCWSTALLAAALWGLAEVALATGPLFWIGLGASALPGDRPLAGLAALGGSGLVAAVQLLIGWGLWRVLTGGPLLRRRGAALLASSILLLHLIGWSQLRAFRGQARSQARSQSQGQSQSTVQSQGTGQGLSQGSANHAAIKHAVAQENQEQVLVLQPAIPTRRKFDADQQLLLRRRLGAAQAEAVQRQVDLLVLPEGALALGQDLPGMAPVEVLSGGFRQVGEELRSSVLRFSPGSLQPSSALDKHRLVPLGEWVPLARWWRWAGLSAVGGVQPGAPSRLLQRPGGALGVAICYELSDGRALAAASRAGAGWLLATANLDPYPLLLQHQFAALSQLRAIETGRWLASAANTGPSLVVDSSGVIRQRLPAGYAATGLFALERRTHWTPYVRWGELPLLLLALVGGVYRAAAMQRATAIKKAPHRAGLEG